VNYQLYYSIKGKIFKKSVCFQVLHPGQALILAALTSTSGQLSTGTSCYFALQFALLF
jgi:hypothetical protein